MIVNGERALAYIVNVDSITPIDGADNIELAHVGGWSLITNIGQFKAGDEAVFFEIDSLLPEAEWSEFLRPKKFRIKTLRLNKFGVWSQGLLMPMDILPKGKSFKVGDDVTKVLGVKYYVAEDNERKAKNPNPNQKYNRMCARNPKLAQKPWFKWLMKRLWGRKLLFVFFGHKSDNPKKFPQWIKKTDEDRCLIGNTKIQTDQGLIRIANIVNRQLDVKVKSYNAATGEIEYKPIVSYQKYDNNDDLIEIEYPYYPNAFKKNRIVCSRDHKFLVDGQYIKAEDIKVGDRVMMQNVCYDESVIPAIYGMLLGDSSVGFDKRCKSNNVRVSTNHSERQLEYLTIKQKMFGEGNYSIIRTGKSGYCDNDIYGGHIHNDVTITNAIMADCYFNGKKKVTKAMADKLTDLSLALWYLDDGSLKHRDDNVANPSIMMSTCGFTKEENEILINMLKDRFGVDCKLRVEKKKQDGIIKEYSSIYITVAGTRKFLDITKNYIPKSMKYKTLKEYEDLPCLLDDMVFEKRDSIVPVEVTNVKVYDDKHRYRHIYDIEVADNHNFFANNVLTHNCENVMWMFDDKSPYVVTEKIDGTSLTVFLDLTGRKPDFGVCSRNVRQIDMYQENFHTESAGTNAYWEQAIKYDLKTVCEKIAKETGSKRVVIQGEVYGEGVQANPLHIDHRDLAVFNLILDCVRLGSLEARDILAKYGVPFVPILDESFILPDKEDFEDFKLYADGKSVINKKCLREGVVCRSMDGQKSFKNVSRKWLMRHE